MTRDNTRLYGAVAAAVLLAGAGGFALSTLVNRPAAPAEEEHGEEGEHAEGGGSEVKLTPQQATAAGIAVVTVSHGGAGDLRLTGRVEAAPSARAAVAAPVSGAVVRLLVAPGSNVGAGGGLAVIRSAEGAAVRAESVAAGAEAEAARAALAREERLFKAGVTARQDFEAARAAAARASAEAVAARAKVSAAGAPGASGETVVRSPIGGVVTALQVAPGGFVAQGGAVAEVANPANVEVVFNAPAEAAAKLRVGAPLKVIGPDGSEADAVIVGIAPLAQGATGAAIVRARPSGGRLTPGAAVSAAIATEAAGYPTVPSEAVQTVAGSSVVFVAEADGFRAQPVTPGRSGAGYTQIIAGLKGGERIAGRGAFVLKAELAKGEAEHGDH
jgi:cobalt-zinc-cadmium efflux system membrane fusion protein